MSVVWYTMVVENSANKTNEVGGMDYGVKNILRHQAEAIERKREEMFKQFIEDGTEGTVAWEMVAGLTTEDLEDILWAEDDEITWITVSGELACRLLDEYSGSFANPLTNIIAT